MFQYLLAFLFINSCYQSLGNPIDLNSSQVLSKPLLKLSAQCGNVFLSNEIKKLVQPCAQTAPPYKKRQVQCLMFYDINRLLCSAVAESKIVLNENFTATLSEKQDVNTLCMTTSEWVFSNFTEYPGYKARAELLKRPVSCGEICGQEDTMDEANYFCKYFKWGFETLKNQVLSSKSTNITTVPAVSEIDLTNKGDINVPIPSNILNANDEETKIPKDEIKHTESAIAQTPSKVEAPVLSELTENKLTNSQTATTPKPILNSYMKYEDKPLDIGNSLEDPSINSPESNIAKNEPVNKSTPSIVVKQDEAQVLPHPELKKDVPEPSNNLPESEKNLPELAKDLPKDIGKENIGNIDLQRPNEDYDLEANDNIGDDDADDTGMDAKLEPETSQHKLLPSINRETSQKDFYPNTMSDGFTEDGDHFFPFFLTSVILVVLLYVLYHNKSKVSKVFFGLIFEGRQSTRRRNSRGHAYRRLDTLEQAMSANAAAPPSKIIY